MHHVIIIAVMALATVHAQTASGPPTAVVLFEFINEHPPYRS
jgi:hypothetical protein